MTSPGRTRFGNAGKFSSKSDKLSGSTPTTSPRKQKLGCSRQQSELRERIEEKTMSKRLPTREELRKAILDEKGGRLGKSTFSKLCARNRRRTAGRGVVREVSALLP
jgi:hypothetical protein